MKTKNNLLLLLLLLVVFISCKPDEKNPIPTHSGSTASIIGLWRLDSGRVNWFDEDVTSFTIEDYLVDTFLYDFLNSDSFTGYITHEGMTDTSGWHYRLYADTLLTYENTPEDGDKFQISNFTHSGFRLFMSSYQGDSTDFEEHYFYFSRYFSTGRKVPQQLHELNESFPLSKYSIPFQKGKSQ